MFIHKFEITETYQVTVAVETETEGIDGEEEAYHRAKEAYENNEIQPAFIDYEIGCDIPFDPSYTIKADGEIVDHRDGG